MSVSTSSYDSSLTPSLTHELTDEMAKELDTMALLPYIENHIEAFVNTVYPPQTPAAAAIAAITGATVPITDATATVPITADATMTVSQLLRAASQWSMPDNLMAQVVARFPERNYRPFAKSFWRMAYTRHITDMCLRNTLLSYFRPEAVKPIKLNLTVDVRINYDYGSRIIAHSVPAPANVAMWPCFYTTIAEDICKLFKLSGVWSLTAVPSASANTSATSSSSTTATSSSSTTATSSSSTTATSTPTVDTQTPCWDEPYSQDGPLGQLLKLVETDDGGIQLHITPAYALDAIQKQSLIDLGNTMDRLGRRQKWTSINYLIFAGVSKYNNGSSNAIVNELLAKTSTYPQCANGRPTHLGVWISFEDIERDVGEVE